MTEKLLFNTEQHSSPENDTLYVTEDKTVHEQQRWFSEKSVTFLILLTRCKSNPFRSKGQET